MKLAIFIEDLPWMHPTKFRFIWQSGFKGEDFFRNQPIRNKNGLWWPCLLTDRDKMTILYRGPSIDASYQVSVHLAEGFQRRRLKCEKLRTTDTKWWQKLTLPLARWAKKVMIFANKIMSINTHISLPVSENVYGNVLFFSVCVYIYRVFKIVYF
jgi:hypothetical protein